MVSRDRRDRHLDLYFPTAARLQETRERAVRLGYSSINKYVQSLIREAPHATSLSQAEVDAIAEKLERSQDVADDEREANLKLRAELRRVRSELDELRDRLIHHAMGMGNAH